MSDPTHSTHLTACAVLLAMLGVTALDVFARGDNGDPIQPYAENPFYWEYRGKPVVLLGGSDDDNLFQWTGAELTGQLDRLVSAGGNYLRNTMSSRDAGNAFPFARTGDRYDLSRWNEAYWERLENFLAQTHRRGVFVQIEFFDMHDLIQPALWKANPWNPDRNVNYTFENTRLPQLPTGVAYRQGESVGRPHEFFLSVPAMNNDTVLLGFQRRFVERVLKHTLRYDHVLYCISNEIHTEYSPEWGWYWADHLRQRADEAGKRIAVTEMYWAPELDHRAHRDALDRPNVFTYFEASQNSVQVEQTNWDKLQFVREYLGKQPRPINNTKIYGASTGPVWAGSDREATERFWRGLIGGSASIRFHRPPTGLGLSEKARRHIRSARMLTDAMNVFVCAPHNDLLSERSSNEAYCLAEPGKQYAVYFPDGGDVKLDVTAAKGALQVRWLEIARGAWQEAQTAEGGGMLDLKTPGPGHWAVLAQPKREAAGQPTTGRIRPWPDNPHYLAWGDTPVFPLGAAGYHSWTPISRPEEVDFHEQLERLAQVIQEIDSPHVCGFVRCLPYDPNNHMHDGNVKELLQPWFRLPDGRYDLSRFEPRWEKRLRDFLQAALDRRIMVALEIWDDWSVTRGPGGAYDPGAGAAWNAHPFNPRNNVNYDETALPVQTAVCDAPFYSTIPSRRGIQPVLDLQKRYVDHLLAIASEFPHILINLANESRAHLDWSHFWADYVRERVPAGMLLGDMPSTNRKDGGGECEAAFSPLTLCSDRRYDFVDIAQGVSRHEFGAARDQALGGGRRIATYRQAMIEAGTRRPLIVSKDYTRGEEGGDVVLWSRFVGGAAAARFHRLAGDHPASVSDFQHGAVGRLGQFISRVPFWRMQPAPDLVKQLPAGAEANVLAAPGSHCVVQLLGGAAGEKLRLNLPAARWTVRWIDPATGQELARDEAAAIASGLELDIPAGPDHRIIHLEKPER